MATEDLPDLDALSLELVQLRHRFEDLTRQHVRVKERVAQFPNDFSIRQGAEIANRLETMAHRIAEIEALLLPLRRVPESSPFGG